MIDDILIITNKTKMSTNILANQCIPLGGFDQKKQKKQCF